MGDDDRNAILRRRRFFIVSAMAGLAATQCDKPQPCLNISPVNTGTVAPNVCLSPPPIPQDASTPETTSTAPPVDAASEGAAPDAGSDASPSKPRVHPPPPPPRVCLSPMRKNDTRGI
jgi:hypothetical protein